MVSSRGLRGLGLPQARFPARGDRLWEAIRLPRLSIAASCLRPLRHPVVLGFAAGTLLYWGYGLSINAAAFWQDHVHSHFLDRIMHVDPFHYSGYPSPLGLWREFCEHTGYLLLRGHKIYLLLPLGIISIAALAWRFLEHGKGLLPNIRALLPVWLLWSVLLSVAFTWIDWRQTKHLGPLLLLLVMAPAAWAGTGRAARLVVTLCMVALLLWNRDTLSALIADFASFRPSPDW